MEEDADFDRQDVDDEDEEEEHDDDDDEEFDVPSEEGRSLRRSLRRSRRQNNEVAASPSVGLRRSLRRRASGADDWEAELALEEEEEEEEVVVADRPRRSVRAAALGAAARLQSQGGSSGDELDRPPGAHELLPEPVTAAWVSSFRQSPHLLWFMPQIGDNVRVFYEGMQLYFVEFCPNDDMPPEADVENVVFTVSDTQYAVHQASGALHCRVTLVSEGRQPLTLPFHSSLYLTDYMVHETSVSRGTGLVAGQMVQAFFSDNQRWYSGQLIRLSPGWSGAAVRWQDEEEAVDLLHPWELFDFDPERQPLGAVQATLKAMRDDERLAIKRLFMRLHAVMHEMLSFACFKVMRVLRRPKLPTVQFPMSFELLLNRLRNDWYRSIGAAQSDGALLIQTVAAVLLQNKSASTATMEMVERLKACFDLTSDDADVGHDNISSGLFSDPNAPLFEELSSLVEPVDEKDGEFPVPEDEEEDEEVVAVASAISPKRRGRNGSNQRKRRPRESDGEFDDEEEELFELSSEKPKRSKQSLHDAVEEDELEFEEDDDEEDHQKRTSRRGSARDQKKKRRKPEEESSGEENRTRKYSLRSSRQQKEETVRRRSSRFLK
jgi:hypothetical protein